MLDERNIGVRLDLHHAQLLELLTEHEQLKPSECLRRALRCYCEKLGLKVEEPKSKAGAKSKTATKTKGSK